MGDLQQMIAFLTETQTNLGAIRANLETIQTRYNSSFAGVNEYRNAELESLQKAFFGDPSLFPGEIRKRYETQRAVETTQFDNHMAELKKKKARLDEAMADADEVRRSIQQQLRTANSHLDQREEKLKRRIGDLEKEIAAFNKTIGELSGGFGFLTNLFRMRTIQAKKDALLDTRESLVVEIEELRGRWQREAASYHRDENDARDRWNDIQTERALVAEKIARLENNRASFIDRAAFLSVLSALEGKEPFLAPPPGLKPPAQCPRCSAANKGTKFFCYYCGARFSPDRPDVAASLIEVGELNRVHGALQAGLTQTVSLLALVRGLARGLEEFIKSVQAVKASQDTYSALPRLAIDVPAASRDFAGRIAELAGAVSAGAGSGHPADFAASLTGFTGKVLTDKNIESFFVAMGDELTKTTKEQWP